MNYVICFMSPHSGYRCYQSHTPGLLSSCRERVRVKEFANHDEAAAFLAEHKLKDGDPVPVGVPGAYQIEIMRVEDANFDPAVCMGFLFECPQKLSAQTGWTPPPLFPVVKKQAAFW